MKRRNNKSNILVGIAGISLIALTLINYNILRSGFETTWHEPWWMGGICIFVWIAIGCDNAKESKKSCFIIPSVFFLVALLLSLIKLIFYRDDLGNAICSQSVVDIIKWDIFVFLLIPILLLANKIHSKA